MHASASIFDQKVQAEIQSRASAATSRDQVALAIFAGLQAAEIRWSDVPLEEMKKIVVAAVCAAREGALAADDPLALETRKV